MSSLQFHAIFQLLLGIAIISGEPNVGSINIVVGVIVYVMWTYNDCKKDIRKTAR